MLCPIICSFVQDLLEEKLQKKAVARQRDMNTLPLAPRSLVKLMLVIVSGAGNSPEVQVGTTYPLLILHIDKYSDQQSVYSM